ncbi:MAG: alkaline phosphatase D family protein [Pseudomonadota bacterium]
MRIAFCSCAHKKEAPSLNGYTEMLKYEPDFLILLGDNIYMDYWDSTVGDKLYQSRNLSDADFAAAMHERYNALLQTTSFQKILEAVKDVYAIWDDHDFAWNNSAGSSGLPVNQQAAPGFLVPTGKKNISHGLFSAFLDAAKRRDYNMPPLNVTQLVNTTPEQGIQQIVQLQKTGEKPVRLFMTDGRWYRSKPDQNAGDMLGEQQRAQLKDFLDESDDLAIIASGSTMFAQKVNQKQVELMFDLHGIGADEAETIIQKQGSTEAWSAFGRDFEVLSSAIKQGKRFLFLGGDIHTNRIDRHGNMWELISSGIGVNLLGALGVYTEKFGILDINGDSVKVSMVSKGKKKETTLYP